MSDIHPMTSLHGNIDRCSMQVPQAREILPGLLQAPLPLVAFARARIPEMARARKSWKGFKGLTNREESALVICTRELTTRGGGESCTEVRHVMCGRGESLRAGRAGHLLGSLCTLSGGLFKNKNFRHHPLHDTQSSVASMDRLEHQKIDNWL